MSVLEVDGLKATLRDAVAPTVSIYMPTHRTGAEASQDPVRLDNLLKDAGRQLAELGSNGRAAERILAPARALMQDTAFWRQQADGLAAILWDGGHVVHRLPLRFREQCYVAARPHVKALLPAVTGEARFFVLALSQNSVRLFDGSREGLRELVSTDIPASIGDVVGYDVEQRSLQFRTQGTGASRGGGRRPAQFHGHGGNPEDQKGELEKFLRVVDDGVRGMIGASRAPLVVAATEPTASVFRNLTKLPEVLPQGPGGNFDSGGAPALFDAAWPFVRPRFDAERARVTALVEEGLGTGRVVQRIREALAAAREGRVETMLVATDAYRWAQPDGDGDDVHEQRQPGDVDLLDLAAAECLLHGGSVHPVASAEIPGDRSVVAAVLRF